MGQINIYLNEKLILDEPEHWFRLDDRTNKIKLEEFIKIPVSQDKECSIVNLNKENLKSKNKSKAVRCPISIKTLKQFDLLKLTCKHRTTSINHFNMLAAYQNDKCNLSSPVINQTNLKTLQHLTNIFYFMQISKLIKKLILVFENCC